MTEFVEYLAQFYHGTIDHTGLPGRFCPGLPQSNGPAVRGVADAKELISGVGDELKAGQK